MLAGFILLAAAPAASADCGSFGRQAYPTGKNLPIPVNGRIVVEDHDFYGGPAIEKAAAKGAVLVGGGQEIPLVLDEVLAGTFHGGTQAVLAPSRDLRPRTEYVVRINGLDLATRIQTGDGEDTGAPRWIEEPALKDMHWVGFGCGPSKQVFFTMKVTDDSPGVRVRVDLLKVGDPEENAASYFVEIGKDGRLAVGHGMCYGGFELEDGARYTAAFSAVDTTGNSTPARLPIQFTAPTPKDGGN